MDWWEEDLLELEWYLLTNKKKEQHLNKGVCNYHVISKKYPNRDLWHNNIRREWQISLSVLSANKMYCYVLCHKNTHNSDHCCLVCWLVCPVPGVSGVRALCVPPAPLFTGSIDHTSYCIIALYWQTREVCVLWESARHHKKDDNFMMNSHRLAEEWIYLYPTGCYYWQVVHGNGEVVIFNRHPLVAI